MFAVLHRRDDGTETLHSAGKVEHFPAIGNDAQPPKVVIDDGAYLTGGRVFVMNEKGATIGKFDLRDGHAVRGSPDRLRQAFRLGPIIGACDPFNDPGAQARHKAVTSNDGSSWSP
jgi:hypothetical protein